MGNEKENQQETGDERFMRASRRYGASNTAVEKARSFFAKLVGLEAEEIRNILDAAVCEAVDNGHARTITDDGKPCLFVPLGLALGVLSWAIVREDHAFAGCPTIVTIATHKCGEKRLRENARGIPLGPPPTREHKAMREHNDEGFTNVPKIAALLALAPDVAAPAPPTVPPRPAPDELRLIMYQVRRAVPAAKTKGRKPAKLAREIREICTAAESGARLLELERQGVENLSMWRPVAFTVHVSVVES